MRGGTINGKCDYYIRMGLSPRARGNLALLGAGCISQGTIPACAGEPSAGAGAGWRPGDYPRVRGGTKILTFKMLTYEGLSPRARGNQIRAAMQERFRGTIPACAGEPDGRICVGRQLRDYPRVRGGTTHGWLTLHHHRGLSPRARGNQCPLGAAFCPHGTIPACAGEPCSRSPCRTCPGDYPRVRGGTKSLDDDLKGCKGLSPRARGNQGPPRGRAVSEGTIPACAGEPLSSSPRRTVTRDYPRVRGGTVPMSCKISCVTGLSPRARGNL